MTPPPNGRPPLTPSRTAAQTIVLAAARLPQPFTEWDLTVQSWKLDPERFAMRGYPEFPDHKRVSMEIMGKKSSNPIVQGFLIHAGTNVYRMTELGRAEVARLGDPNATESDYAVLSEVLDHPAFRSWRFSQTAPLADPFRGGAAKLRLRISLLTGRLVIAPRPGRPPYSLQDVSDAISFLEVVSHVGKNGKRRATAGVVGEV